MFSRFVSTLALCGCLCWSILLSASDRPPEAQGDPQGSAVTQQIVGHILTADRNDPSDRRVPVFMVNPDRVKPAGPLIFAETPEEQAARVGVPCSTIVYRNTCLSGCFVYRFGGEPPFDNAVDDLSLPANSTNRFICAAQAVTSTFAPFGGPPQYNLRQQLWDTCPDDPTAHLLAQGDFEAIPADGLSHVTTITVDPPYFSPPSSAAGMPPPCPACVGDSDVSGFSAVFLLVKSSHPGADIVIAGDTTDPGDIGSTGNFFYTAGMGCAPFAFSFTGSGFYMILYGGPGPEGSCCDLGSGSCTDGLVQGACDDFLTLTWSPRPCSDVNCAACTPPICNIGDQDDLENEPDCYTNYDDTTNRGCNNLAAKAYSSYFTPLSCNQSGCGRTGTYTYVNFFIANGSPTSATENRRDADRYALDLTQDTRVTWTVSGKFPSQALISFTLKQTNNVTAPIACPEYRIESFDGATVAYNNFAARYNARTAISAAPCQDAVATAILAGRDDPGGAGPFRYMLIARPSIPKLADTATCGIPYNFNLSCESVSPQPTGACCTRNACVEVSALACLLLNDGTHPSSPYYQGDGTTCAGAGSVCSGVPANDLCENAIVLTCTSCVIAYDSTFASAQGDMYGLGGTVSKDVWFDYNAPAGPAGSAASYGCSSGRVVCSTLYNCYNTKLQILKIADCALNTAQRCVGLAYQGAFLPIELEVGPPIVDVGPWVYGKSFAVQPPGTCFKIRVGGLTDADFGPGVVRIDYVCSASIGNGWDTSSGRCCFWNASTHTGNCMIAPRISNGINTGCGCLGGYIQDTTDYFELSTTHPTSGGTLLNASEIQGKGCATWPCPAEGEACYNAWDLNALLGGGAGTAIKSTRNRIYFKYQVTAGTPLGSGITIDACGSDGAGTIDRAMCVYRGFNLTSGECHQPDTSQGGPGIRACTNTAYNNLELARVNDCGPQDILSASATDRVACFGPGETNPCLCLTVVASSPQAGQIPLNAPIYIGMGLKNTYSGSPRPFIDPVRSDSCGQDVNFSIHVGGAPSCFSCSVSCPAGSTAEGENFTCTNYVDHYDAGCKALAASDQRFRPIVDGQTYCGTSATYRVNKTCTGNTDCGFGDQCVSATCQGPDDNAKDYDFYRIQLTQPKRITWSVAATFPVAVQILESPDDKCTSAVTLATQINLGQCVTTVVAADACAGYVYLSVAPGVDTGVGCGTGNGKLYYATLNLGTPSVLAASCCKGDMNNDGVVNGADIRLWLDQLLPIPDGQPATQLDKVEGCFNVATCRADLNGDYSVDLSDLDGFVAALLSSSACAATTCGDSSACHAPVADDVGVVSDLNAVTFGGGFRVVDDFKVTSPGVAQPVSKLCWYGFYFNFNTLIACQDHLGDSPDDFRVTIYQDSSGLPDNPIANGAAVVPLNLVKTNTGQTLTYLSKTVTRIKYEADLPAGITVDGDTCYWLEVVNKTTGTCLWVWETSANSGNGVSLQQPGGFPAGTSNFYAFNLAAQDQSFCLPGLRIDAADCGLPIGRCCTYENAHNGQAWLQGACSIQTQVICKVVVPGPGQITVWTPGADCSTLCPQFPGNDNCADALLITTGPIYTGSSIIATTDGPTMSCEANCGQLCNTAPDVWYKWVSGPVSLQTTVAMCDPIPGYPGYGGDPLNYPKNQFTYDAVMVMYTNCPVGGGIQVTGGCNDDGCDLTTAATVSRFVLAAGTLSTNTTYWIRVSGWSGNRGNFTLRVNEH